MNNGKGKRPDLPGRSPQYYTAKELSEYGKDGLPEELISGKHLIYSSPATLAFNSPGAEGFGVKRAGLAIPGSVMLLVAPGCCGRNTTILSELSGYSDRFFYLMMDETDIVTGRHLKKIPQAVREVCQCLDRLPTVVMICLTCVDALLGTDMERMCRKAEKECGTHVLPCYMYALTREGRRPPMVHVRQSIYSLLEPRKKKAASVNLLGYFAPLVDDCELYPLLEGWGVKRIREISRCRTYEDYLSMAEANFNLVLYPEARAAAADMADRLAIPYVELYRLYRIDKIHSQYQLFAGVLSEKLDDRVWYERAEKAIETFAKKWPGITFSIGEGCNANAFELGLALLEYGFGLAEVFKDPMPEDYVYIDRIAGLSPHTRIYSNLEPSMIYYDMDSCGADLVIGKDALYYHPDRPGLAWSDDIAPFGYAGVWRFFEACGRLLEENGGGKE